MCEIFSIVLEGTAGSIFKGEGISILKMGEADSTEIQ
jgi:hypothetical protein